MTTTHVRLWTVNEYHQMITAGVFNPEERIELLEGKILRMAAKNPPHAATNLCAANVLNLALAGKALIRIQDPIALSPTSEPEPDIAVVKLDRRFYLDCHPSPDEVFLLVEIADTTLHYDRGQKAPAYARAGILEYWILDVNLYQVYRFSQPKGGKYQEEEILDEGAVIAMVAFPEVRLKVAHLFP
ncbi:MAG: Uma2 family endonuclease [Symploca sp. SIO1A3]|nr:Uma2 family endonuclease [Symploca sp. SIO1A3]